jgi:ABC-type sugar transport system ATPase subunit
MTVYWQKLRVAWQNSSMTTTVIDAPFAPASLQHVTVEGLTLNSRGDRVIDNASFEFCGSGIHGVLTPSTRASAAVVAAIAGTHPVTSGRIWIDGRSLDFGDRRAMLDSRVAVLGADVGLLPARSIAANIFLGREHAIREDMVTDATTILTALGCSLDALVRVSGLVHADRLIVELARAIAARAELVVAAEPSDTIARALERAADLGPRVLIVSCEPATIRGAHDSATLTAGA